MASFVLTHYENVNRAQTRIARNTRSIIWTEFFLGSPLHKRENVWYDRGARFSLNWTKSRHTTFGARVAKFPHSWNKNHGLWSACESRIKSDWSPAQKPTRKNPALAEISPSDIVYQVRLLEYPANTQKLWQCTSAPGGIKFVIKLSRERRRGIAECGKNLYKNRIFSLFHPQFNNFPLSFQLFARYPIPRWEKTSAKGREN